MYAFAPSPSSAFAARRIWETFGKTLDLLSHTISSESRSRLVFSTQLLESFSAPLWLRLAMSLSSVSVIVNALRLRQLKV